MSCQRLLQQMIGVTLVMLLLVGCGAPAATPTPIPPTATLAPEPPTATPAPAATPSPTAEATPLTTEVTKNIVYANVGERATNLDVYAPSEDGSWPVVIVVHGARQSKQTFVYLAKTIASQGAVVYNIDVMHRVPFSLSIERIACAVRFARATAADYGGDPSRVTLVGSSAGASTGVVVAMAGDNFEGDCVVTGGSALVDAFVGFEGRYDIATTVRLTPFDHTFLKDEDPELWHAINPYSHIGLNPDLQVRLVHGDDVDTAWYDIPPDVSIDFYQALVDAGYDVELTVVDGDSHTALTRSSSDAFALTVELVMEVARSSSQ